MRRHSTILCIFCCAVCMQSPGQTEPLFAEKLTTGEGLSSNSITDIVQDDGGFLWIATRDGLNRFDGTEVVRFFHQGDSSSLPHNSVYCLEKLPGNRLAIGTQAGLSIYEGNTGRFRNFYFRQNRQFDEFNNAITVLERDASGNLWAGSKNCVFVLGKDLDLKASFYSSYTVEDTRSRRLRFVEKIFPLADGRVLLGLYDGWHTWRPGDTAFETLGNSSLRHRFGFLLRNYMPPLHDATLPYFPYAHVFKVYGRFFLCVQPGTDSLLLYDEDGQRLSAAHFPYNKYPYILWSQQASVMDSSKILFLFHNYGMATIPVSWRQGKPYIQASGQLRGAQYEFVHAICDNQDNWWLATSGEGLQRISMHNQFFKGHNLVDARSGAPSRHEMMGATRYGNRLWIATYGDGFFGIDLATGKQRHYRIPNRRTDDMDNLIWNVRQVSDDTLWLGTQNGMYWYHIPQGIFGRLAGPGKPAVLDSVAITTQFVDSRGLVWIGLGRGSGLCYYDPVKRSFRYYPGSTEGGYPLRYPTGIAEDGHGDIWFVNDASRVLVTWQRNTDRFRSVRLPGKLDRVLSDLSGICHEGDSILWLGSVSSGLIKFRPASEDAEVFGRDKGLANSNILSIYRDGRGRLWLVTGAGISYFDPHNETFANFSERDGLPVKSATALFYYDTLDTILYSGGHGSYFYFNPTRMNFSPPPAHAMITSVEVNGKLFMPEPGESLHLGARQNDISISYTAIDLANGPAIRYSYRLVGEDTSWTMAGRLRQINFSRLAPGDYVFMVRASNSSGEWNNEPAMLRFSIKSPFTQTAWFYGLVILGIAAAFYGQYRFRLTQLMRAEQMRSEISRNLHDEVGSALTNISLGSLLARQQLRGEDPVSRMLERIHQDSQDASESMREIVWSINPKIDTIGEAFPRMVRYASELLEAKNIELDVEIAPGIEDLKLSMYQRRDLYLLFKEAINNMAKYSQARHAEVRLGQEGRRLFMVIADDGTGFDSSAEHFGNGLKNMKERADEHRWKLDIRSRVGEGTSITLETILT